MPTLCTDAGTSTGEEFAGGPFGDTVRFYILCASQQEQYDYVCVRETCFFREIRFCDALSFERKKSIIIDEVISKFQKSVVF